MKQIQWDILQCRETFGYKTETQEYLYCKRLPVVGIVLHHRDQKAYTMCLEHAFHNCANRGGVLLTTNNLDLQKEFGGELR